MCTIDMLRTHLVHTEAPRVRSWLEQHGLAWAIMKPIGGILVIRQLFASEDYAAQRLARCETDCRLVELAAITDEQLVASLAGVYLASCDSQPREECVADAA